MSHGFMGIRTSGFLYMGGFVAFFYYLSQSFKGPEKPKFILEKEYVDMVKPYQPGLVAEHYYKENQQS